MGAQQLPGPWLTVCSALHFPPSRRIGELKKALEEAVDSGEVPSHQGPEVYLAFLRDNAARFGLPTA